MRGKALLRAWLMGAASFGLLAALWLLGGCAGGSDSVPGFGEVPGTVVDDATSLGISGATVTIGGVTATTTAEGTFSMRNVPAGNQRYTVTATGYLSVRDKEIEVRANRSVALNVRLAEGAPTTGTVYGVGTGSTSQQAIAEVEVTIGTLTTTTTSSGTYTLSGVATGNQNVTFTKAGYVPRTEAVAVVAGGTHELNVSLSPITTGTVTGTVTDAASGLALAGVTVSIEALSSTTTDANGVYTLTDVPAGNWIVSFTRTDYRDVQRSVTVTAGLTTTEDAAMMSPSQGVLNGQIRNRTSGALQAGVSVTIVELERYTTSDAQGFYQFAGVPQGRYTIYVALTDYGTLTREDIELEGGETTVLDIELAPTVGGVVGFVFERDPQSGGHGEPASDVTVRVGNAGTVMTTDSDGHYEVHDIPAEETGTAYTVYAWSSEHDLAQVDTTLYAGKIVQCPDIVVDLAQ